MNYVPPVRLIALLKVIQEIERVTDKCTLSIETIAFHSGKAGFAVTETR